MGTALLHLFIYFDVLLLGVVLTIAGEHAYAHFRSAEHEKPDARRDEAHLPPAIKEQLLQKAETNFSHTLERSTSDLEKDLRATEEKLIAQLDKLGSELVDKEMGRYKDELAKLHQHTTAVATQATTDLGAHQSDLKAKMQEEFAAEKQHLLDQIDSKLTDAVMSFLLDTLQHNIDLGAQTAYLTAMLEEHKEEFKKGVADEAPAA